MEEAAAVLRQHLFISLCDHMPLVRPARGFWLPSAIELPAVAAGLISSQQAMLGKHNCGTSCALQPQVPACPLSCLHCPTDMPNMCHTAH